MDAVRFVSLWRLIFGASVLSHLGISIRPI